MALLFPHDFTVFFPEHLSMATSKIIFKQSILAQLKTPSQLCVPFIFVQQLNLHVHILINFAHWQN